MGKEDIGERNGMNDGHDALPDLLFGIIDAARRMFPGQDWATVENHIRRAWNDVSHDADASWSDISDRVRREWEAAG